MIKGLIVPVVGLASILGACTSPDDQYDYIEANPVAIAASPLTAKVGEEVVVTLTVEVGLSERSRISERPISDIKLGVCFGYGLTADSEGIVEPHGFCFQEVEVLPNSYKMLSGTEYTGEFDDVVIRRGESYEFEHTFAFTLTEANVLALEPHMEFTDKSYGAPSHSGSGSVPKHYPIVTFQ